MTTGSNRHGESEIAAGLRMLLLDVDGVLTDGGIILVGRDEEAKRFDVQDGMGITLARAAGLKVGIVTSRSSHVVSRRAEELHIDEVFQGARRKTEVLDQLVNRYEIKAAQAAYIGDDIQDIPIMERVGMPIAVQNAAEAVKGCSVYVTKACGGHGAVREAVEWLLDLRGDKDKAYRFITS
jgi:3-deoxy-D-manno-octulosonate 8-phosphate phosphatase (KDO 8-P phosphatase)